MGVVDSRGTTVILFSLHVVYVKLCLFVRRWGYLLGERRHQEVINMFRSGLIYFGFREMAPLASEICIRLVVTFDDFPDVGMPTTNLSSNLTFTEPVVMQVQYSVSVHRRQRTTIVVYPTVDVLS